MDNFDLKKYLAEGKLLKENIDFPEMEDEFEGAMDAMVVEPEVYLKDILKASADDLVSDDYYEVMNAVEQRVYTNDEAVKLAKSWAKEKLSTLDEGKLNENASGKVLVDKVEPRWIIADPYDIDMKGLGGGRNSTITYYKRESSAQKELDDRINYSKNGGELGYDDEYKGKIASAEVIEVEMQVKIVVK